MLSDVPTTNITCNQHSVKTMLAVVQYLRLQERPASRLVLTVQNQLFGLLFRIETHLELKDLSKINW